MLRSPLDKPIISWEEFDRLFTEAFTSPKPKDNAHQRSLSEQSFIRPISPPPVRSASPEPLSDHSVGSGGVDGVDAADALSESFTGFISEEEIPMYTPLIFPTLRKERESSESLRSDEKLSQSMTSQRSMSQSTGFPKRPRVMSNHVSSRRTISTSGSMPRIKRQNTKSKMQFQTSTDGTTTTATLDVPDIIKDSLNIDFHQDHLNVTWRTATITEKVLKDSMIRERKEKRYTQAIICPEGTTFENIRACLKSRTLTISFPSNPKVQGTNKT